MADSVKQSKSWKKRTLGINAYHSPLSDKNAQAETPLLMNNVPENDDYSEKKERQQRKLLELQQNNIHSPKDATKRQSVATGLDGFTNTQISEHYANCIKLSTENKINMKNAFSLHLIDYMAEMLKKKDSEMNNFQVAGCTLDASAKIYASRVDFVHTELYKIMGGLARSEQSKANKSQDENKDSDGASGSDREEAETVRKKKKVKRKSTIEKNLKNITVDKFEFEFQMSPVFQNLFSAVGEGGSEGLLFNNLSSIDDSCELILDFSIPAFPKSQSKLTHNTDSYTDISRFKGVIQKLSTEDLHICPILSDFKFSGWTPDNDVDIKEKSPLKSTKEAFAFRPSDEPYEDVFDNRSQAYNYSDSEAGGEENDMFEGDSERSNDKSEDRPAKKLIRQLDVMELRDVLAEKPSEYSYFKPNFSSVWAGPNHWKVFPISKGKKSEAADGCKKTRKKNDFVIQYDVTLDTKTLFKKSKKKKLLADRTFQLWSTNKTTRPVDLHYKPEQLGHFFIRVNLLVHSQISSRDVDDDIDHYDYDNPNDCENFCPNEMDDNDGSDIETRTRSSASSDRVDCSVDLFSQFSIYGNDTIFNNTLSYQPMQVGSDGGYVGDNLLQQPFKIPKITIAYAKMATKVDVKKVKTVMWNILNKKEESAESINYLSDGCNFSKLHTNVLGKVSTKLAENLSIPFSFVILLYLANEKNLYLENKNDLSDIVIKQDPQVSELP